MAALLLWQAAQQPSPEIDVGGVASAFEAHVTLPAGSLPVSGYARYYAPSSDGSGTVAAVWVGSRAGDPDFPPGIHLGEPLPTILTHAGCAGVIRFTIQPDGVHYAGECDALRPPPPPPPRPQAEIIDKSDLRKTRVSSRI